MVLSRINTLAPPWRDSLATAGPHQLGRTPLCEENCAICKLRPHTKSSIGRWRLLSVSGLCVYAENGKGQNYHNVEQWHKCISTTSKQACKRASKQAKQLKYPVTKWTSCRIGTFPPDWCWRSPFLPPMSVPTLIAGTALFPPPPRHQEHGCSCSSRFLLFIAHSVI